MAINISEARVKQVTDVITKWSQSFRAFDANHTQEDLLSTLDENVHWYDHGFHVVRIGHEAVLGLHKGFIHCNQPFEAVNKSVLVTTEGAAVQQLWIGRCTNGIVRPDGQVIMKASGRDFKTMVGMFVKVNEAGKITRIDEYDHRYWDEGKPEEEYPKVGAVKNVSQSS